MATSLPSAEKLPVEHLAACFQDVTNSYKFYWLLAILDHIQSHSTQTVIPFHNLLAHMVAYVWYPTNYFRLSFGKQDRLSQIALRLGTEDNLPATARKQEIIVVALTHLTHNTPLGQEIKSLERFVPYRFLRPFFRQQLRGVPDSKVNGLIASLADSSFTSDKPPLYRLFAHPERNIEFHPLWFEYLHRHLEIVRGFCLWHLVKHVQKNNPNVPNIAAKLFEPQQRNLRQGRTFWNLAYRQLGSFRCIYSGQPVQPQGYSLDHFLPWRFVAHDLLWNLVPVPKNVNSAKGDCLPDLSTYFDPFARLQYDALQSVVAVTSPRQAKSLEDYTLLLAVTSVSEIRTLSFDTFLPRIPIAT